MGSWGRLHNARLLRQASGKNRIWIVLQTCQCIGIIGQKVVNLVYHWRPGLRSRNRRFLGGAGFLTTLGVGVGFFCPTTTPDVPWDHYLHHTRKLGIPVEMVQFLLKLLLKQRFLAVHHDFHWFQQQPNFIPLNIKGSESDILERSNILAPTPQPCWRQTFIQARISIW